MSGAAEIESHADDDRFDGYVWDAVQAVDAEWERVLAGWPCRGPFCVPDGKGGADCSARLDCNQYAGAPS